MIRRAKQDTYQRWWKRLWREQHGSSVAQAAAVALLSAALIGALVLVRGSFTGQVTQSFNCVISAISGGGGSCNGGGASTTGGTSANGGSSSGSNQSSQKHDCGAGCQVLGFFKGFGEGAVDTVKGLWTLGSDGVKLAMGDQATLDKYGALVDAFGRDPGGTLLAMGKGFIAPAVDAWNSGNYGEAAGRVSFDIASFVVADHGLDKLGKLGKVDEVLADGTRVASRTGEGLEDGGGVLSKIPCVGYGGPLHKGPGLAAPLAAGCPRGTRAAQLAEQAEQDSIAAARAFGGDINYGKLDALNRPTGVQARITKGMVGPDGIGSEPLSGIRPPGYVKDQGFARGHLLGDQLGGSGKVDSNLVTLYQNPVNSPIMRDFESAVRRAVENGEIVDYKVTPIYVGDNPIPVRIIMEATGDKGYHLYKIIENKPPITTGPVPVP
ncbi:MAG: DNA/RNA non-specific endonuclease [Herpetosiphonaceae bacterium]|nr:DNA/RNA non-specific endonuclease [Herpetosiphonaceae bacterium]